MGKSIPYFFGWFSLDPFERAKGPASKVVIPPNGIFRGSSFLLMGGYWEKRANPTESLRGGNVSKGQFGNRRA